MSSVKKQLKNQRSFRERLRSLEDKVKMYEKAYVDSQNENKLLKEEVEILKRRLSRFEKDFAFDSSKATSATIYAAQNMLEESQMNDNQIHHDVDDSSSNDDIVINDETVKTN
ncbi:16698_t:CDS:1 [Dentiscutata erythropus]|uniref:16698_t:CDS:1 n=1 Tax=Dentiscutata erythropus TaxID=1348616 RepID=A0A9N9I449_9GLOM|nr:16698_t:CDS:1 [Dentiscutata erythropus]